MKSGDRGEGSPRRRSWLRRQWGTTVLSPLWWDDLFAWLDDLRYAARPYRLLGVVLLVLSCGGAGALWQRGAFEMRAPAAPGGHPDAPVPPRAAVATWQPTATNVVVPVPGATVIGTAPLPSPQTRPATSRAPAMTATSLPPAPPSPTLPPQPSATAPIAPTPPVAQSAPQTGLPPVNLHTSRDTQRRVSASETALRTGELQVTVDYDNGNRMVLQIQFDRGPTPQESGMYVRSTYRGVTGSRHEERIQVGMRAWQRQPGEGWMPADAPGTVEEQLRPYLPQIAAAMNPQIQEAGDQRVVRWYDAARDADLVLTAVAATGQPQQLVQRVRSVGLTLNVAYIGWNTTITLPVPPGS